MNLKLIVVRTPDAKSLAAFYGLFGLSFQYHQHGNSPFHYSTEIGGIILEIYPFTKSQKEADKNLRLGFSLYDFEKTIQLLKDNAVVFAAEPKQTDFGFMAIVVDSDGRKVELYRK
jgi:predicted enzyme related to lactoylglutathione lyase